MLKKSMVRKTFLLKYWHQWADNLDLCPLLGLSPPQYVLAPASNNAQNMLSGYATFANAPSMPARIGEVRNVFGKKNAREEVAKGVWEVLEELASKRNVKIDVKEGTDADGDDAGGLI